jgi:uncharacterized protein YneR
MATDILFAHREKLAYNMTITQEEEFQMNIHIEDQAAQWYQEEMLLNKGDFVRFFARYGGCSTVQQGFSLGVSNEQPHDAGVQTEKNGITYFIEEKDLWYFDNHDLFVTFNEKAQEPEFKYNNE